MADPEANLEAAARATVRGATGGTRTVGIVGWPVTHSLSPSIHNAAFAALQLDWIYVPLPVPPERAAEAIAALPALGFAGANVTMPHKSTAAAVCTSRSEDAELCDAVNTLVSTSDGLEGHNTDVAGFARFLLDDAAFDPAGRSAVLLGAGGAARACALALARHGLASLTAVARRPEQAAALEGIVGEFGTSVEVRAWDDPPVIAADLVVNATPLGVSGESLPAVPIEPAQVVVDLLYRPAITPLLHRAREMGAMWFGGLGLLLHQAALSFELWTGHVPPLDVMSAAALAELAGAR
ncbi:MAG: shikimate dehydrogenase [Actinomycetota bacterium]